MDTPNTNATPVSTTDEGWRAVVSEEGHGLALRYDADKDTVHVRLDGADETREFPWRQVRPE